MKKTNKNTNMGMVFGMCLGISIGTALGSSFDNMAIGSCLGLCIGMALGLVLGAQKDKEVNKQLEEKGYTVKAIEGSKVTVIDNSGEEMVIDVPKGQMEEEEFSVGDVVFLDEDGLIEQAFDKEEDE